MYRDGDYLLVECKSTTGGKLTKLTNFNVATGQISWRALQKLLATCDAKPFQRLDLLIRHLCCSLLEAFCLGRILILRDRLGFLPVQRLVILMILMVSRNGPLSCTYYLASGPNPVRRFLQHGPTAEGCGIWHSIPSDRPYLFLLLNLSFPTILLNVF